MTTRQLRRGVLISAGAGVLTSALTALYGWHPAAGAFTGVCAMLATAFGLDLRHRARSRE